MGHERSGSPAGLHSLTKDTTHSPTSREEGGWKEEEADSHEEMTPKAEFAACAQQVPVLSEHNGIHAAGG